MLIPRLPSLGTDSHQPHLSYWVMLALHHNQHFRGSCNWAIKSTSAREGGWEKEANTISAQNSSPSFRPIFHYSNTCPKQGLKILLHLQMQQTYAVQGLLEIICSAQCKPHNLAVNRQSNWRWTLTTNHFQRRSEHNTFVEKEQN